MRKISNLKSKGRSTLILALLLYSALLPAQVKITGRVTDGKGDPVSGTNVVVKNSTIGAASAADGSYQLTANLKNGKQSIVFSHIGFNTSEREITINGSRTYTLDITLMEDVAGLDEVVVTGTTAGTTRRQLGSYISTLKRKI